MIVDFTIGNFRSIKDPQTFSLYAETPGSHLADNIAWPGGDGIGVLKCAGIYGANAAGKSNLLAAFLALQYIINRSGDLKAGEMIPCYEPYLLSAQHLSAASHFEIEFFVPDPARQTGPAIRYRYRVAFDRDRIVEENLVFYPSAKAALVFDRNAGDTWETIRFGSHYKGGNKRLPFFANNAYLSKAGNSADAPQMIRDVYNRFRNNLDNFAPNETKSIANWFENANALHQVGRLLALVDTGIFGVKFAERQLPDIIGLPEHFPDAVKKSILHNMKYQPVFAHRTDAGETVFFEAETESTGTRKFFGLAPTIIDVLHRGGVLIMDELDNSMHPFMAELIIKLFNDPRVNRNNAQLIFSTHNVNLMTPELLRRDQIWLAEKRDGATTLFSLDDFDKNKVKPQSPFSQWYIDGRFGGIPAIDYQGIVNLFQTAAANAQTPK